ncbi:methyltransferase family protein [Prosthecomicrobium sp. N25]|uniref:methyltransferase family protein n=1 Tax=Prosthecomicrobium sp. N25 TaxID=3129254 RepID=UPI0030788DFB
MQQTATTDRPAIAPPDEHARLRRLQKRRKLALALASVLLFGLLAFVSSPDWFGGLWHEGVELLGLVLIGVAIVGRVWCTLYIGGRKAAEVVDTGPYSISRNPLYLFSFVGSFGIGAATGSLVAAVLVTAMVVAVFTVVVKGEERSLAALFGPAYADYCRRVPRFGPAFSLWRDMETVTVQPRLLWHTLRDGLVFFLVVPLFEFVDLLQAKGMLVPVLVLP